MTVFEATEGEDDEEAVDMVDVAEIDGDVAVESSVVTGATFVVLEGFAGVWSASVVLSWQSETEANSKTMRIAAQCIMFENSEFYPANTE